MDKDYWERDANGNVKARRYVSAQTLPAVGAGGAGIGLMLVYAKDAAQFERITAEGFDAAEKLMLYLPEDRAKEVARLILKALEQAEEMKGRN